MRAANTPEFEAGAARKPGPWAWAVLAVMVLGFSLALVLAGDFALGALRGAPAEAPDGTCIVPDVRLHHRWKPECTMRTTWGKQTFTVETNSLGHRDASRRQVPRTAPGIRRVVLMGDSFSVCCLPWKDLVVGALQRRRPDVDFHAAGMLSWSPTIYARRVRELIESGFAFDDLVVMIDISDIQDEAAVYGVDAGDRLYDLNSRTRAEDTGQPNDALHDVLRRLAASIKLRRWLPMTHDFIRRLAWRELAHHQVPVVDRGAWTYRRSDAMVERRAYGSLGIAGGVAKAQAAMDGLAAAARGAGIRLHVVVYPWPQQLLHDKPDSVQATIWRRWCERAGCASFVDLFPALFDAKARSRDWYAENFIGGDVHYNARGNDRVAAAIVEGALR